MGTLKKLSVAMLAASMLTVLPQVVSAGDSKNVNVQRQLDRMAAEERAKALAEAYRSAGKPNGWRVPMAPDHDPNK